MSSASQAPRRRERPDRPGGRAARATPAPLTELIEDREHPGSSLSFFDIGNLLAFFDFPEAGRRPYAEVLGGLHHVAISVEPARWEALVAKLTPLGEMCGEHVL